MMKYSFQDVVEYFFHKPIDDYQLYIYFSDHRTRHHHFPQKNPEEAREIFHSILDGLGKCELELIVLMNGREDTIRLSLTTNHRLPLKDLNEVVCIYCEDQSLERQYVRLNCGHRAHPACLDSDTEQRKKQWGIKDPKCCLACEMVLLERSRLPIGIITQYCFKKPWKNKDKDDDTSVNKKNKTKKHKLHSRYLSIVVEAHRHRCDKRTHAPLK